MSRRKSRSSTTVPAAVVIVILAMVYGFYEANQEIINQLLVGFSITFIAIAIIIFSYKLYIFMRDKKQYLETSYSKETNYPYSKYLKEPGKKFEAKVFNALRSTVGENYSLLTNVSLPQVDAFNIDSQIDLILLHDTGLYVIEVKDYSGPLIGRVDEDVWKPYSLNNKKKKSNKFDEKYIVNWGLYNQFKAKGYSNPIKQNDIHIRTIANLFPAKYENIVIFSDTMFVDTGNGPKSIIKEIFSLSDFQDYIKQKQPQYNMVELTQLEAQIKSMNRQSSSQESLHRARVR